MGRKHQHRVMPCDYKIEKKQSPEGAKDENK
jgi:hypothetical protein